MFVWVTRVGVLRYAPESLRIDTQCLCPGGRGEEGCVCMGWFRSRGKAGGLVQETVSHCGQPSWALGGSDAWARDIHQPARVSRRTGATPAARAVRHPTSPRNRSTLTLASADTLLKSLTPLSLRSRKTTRKRNACGYTFIYFFFLHFSFSFISLPLPFRFSFLLIAKSFPVSFHFPFLSCPIPLFSFFMYLFFHLDTFCIFILFPFSSFPFLFLALLFFHINAVYLHSFLPSFSNCNLFYTYFHLDTFLTFLTLDLAFFPFISISC